MDEGGRMKDEWGKILRSGALVGWNSGEGQIITKSFFRSIWAKSETTAVYLCFRVAQKFSITQAFHFLF
jgi:hypothetical protein